MSRYKVVVIGPSEAGKSTLVRLLTERALNLAYRGRTVAMDHGLLRRDGASIAIVGVPGQPRFASVREVLSQRARGAIWVHPAGREPDGPTIELLNGEASNLPYFVLVNQRQDGSREAGYEPPAGLRPPGQIITGDLVKDADLLTTIKNAIWSWLPD